MKYKYGVKAISKSVNTEDTLYSLKSSKSFCSTYKSLTGISAININLVTPDFSFINSVVFSNKNSTHGGQEKLENLIIRMGVPKFDNNSSNEIVSFFEFTTTPSFL